MISLPDESENKSLQSDASAVYRGYRLQALYALSRILCDQENEDILIYQPEGIEDLALFDSADNLIEMVQVKAYSSNFVLSDLEPQKPNCFFQRVLKKCQENKPLQTRLACFGQFGKELSEAWAATGDCRKSVTNKLLKLEYNEHEINLLYNAIQLTHVNESEILSELMPILKESSLGSDPEVAFDLLNYWIYTCSENKTKITRKILIDKLNNIGKFYAERMAHHQEWFTSISPIEDMDIASSAEQLANEFFSGVSVRYEHILADLDVQRSEKLQEIQSSLSENRIVVIHGASGQGKSALAYRYLHDYFPDNWRFAIKSIENRRHALSLALALNAHAKAFGAPMAIYIDVSPRDQDWTELVKALANNQYLRIIVTIREEDWKRSKLSPSELTFSNVELSFERSEALSIYQRLSERKIIAEFIDFEDAWNRFGRGGPLLEFVYLVTKGNSLRERLEQQVERLQNEARCDIEPKQIDLLRLVSIASAYGARLKTKESLDSLNLRNPPRTLDLLEKEYLVRRTEDGSFIDGLHPIRSTILAGILTDDDLCPWDSNACQCLSLMPEEDLEVFLLHSFSRVSNKEIETLWHSISNHTPSTWTGVKGVMKALIWLGVREYVNENLPLIQNVYSDCGSGWLMTLRFDISDASPDIDLIASLGEIVSEDRRKQIDSFRAQQTDNERVYKYVNQWLPNLSQEPEPPITDPEWDSLAEASFWDSRLSQNSGIPDWLNNVDLSSIVTDLSLDIIANLVIGLYSSQSENFIDWLHKNRCCILDKFCEETRTVALEDDGETVKAHFILSINEEADNSKQNDGDFVHQKTMRIVHLLRKLYPDRETYSTRGYGHQCIPLAFQYDPTEKNIPKQNLPIKWLTNLNARFRSLANSNFRPDTWDEYANQFLQLRRNCLNILDQLIKAIIVYFRKQNISVNMFKNQIDAEKWDQCKFDLLNPTLLPKCAVDEWGFADESSAPNEDESTRSTEMLLSVWNYGTYIQAMREFTNNLSTWFVQAQNAILHIGLLAKAKNPTSEKDKMRNDLINLGYRDESATNIIHNLTDTLKSLSSFQNEFRQLFSGFIHGDVLDSLDQQENDKYKKIWHLWYYFASSPHRVIQNIIQESEKSFKEALRQTKIRTRRIFKKPDEDIDVSIISDDLLWNSEPALWITFNVTQASDIYNAFDTVICGLKDGIGKAEYPSLKRLALELDYPNFLVIPLVRGKCLAPNAWKLLLHVILSEGISDGEDWWNYVEHPIPLEALGKLHLECWQHQAIDQMNQLFFHYSYLSIQVSHISDINRIPDVDEFKMGILENYAETQSHKMSEEFQKVLDGFGWIADRIASFSEDELKYHPSLKEAGELLGEIYPLVLPKEDMDGECNLLLSEHDEWSSRLKAMIMQVQMIRFRCLDDILFDQPPNN